MDVVLAEEEEEGRRASGFTPFTRRPRGRAAFTGYVRTFLIGGSRERERELFCCRCKKEKEEEENLVKWLTDWVFWQTKAHFLDELVRLIPKECASFGKKVTDIVQLEDGRAQMKFHDGSTADADAVIGCDGIKSQVRPILLGSESPEAYAVFTGKYAYRGLIPMDKAVRLLGDELARNSQMYIGYHGHVLTFPIEQGKTMNVVAFRSSESGKWDDERWVLPMERARMEKDFEQWGPDVKSILSLMEKPDVWALFEHPPAESYFKGRVCLLGDAAHGSTPHHGAGAGMALEDAYILSELLGLVQESNEIEQAFVAYDTTRRARSQKLVVASKEAGYLYDLELEGVGDDVGRLNRNLDERFKWVWDHDLETDLITAKEIMGRARNPEKKL